MSTPRLTIVTTSTRPGRVGPAVARWFSDLAREQGSFEVVEADLAEIALPLYDEPHQPVSLRYEHEHTRRWAAIVDSSDAMVLVLPEYNHSFNAATKNALDFLYHEWRHLSVGLVSYGGTSAGTRAAAQLKVVLGALKAVAVGDVSVPMVGTHIVEGVFSPPELSQRTAATLLGDLAAMAGALAPLRAAARAARVAR